MKVYLVRHGRSNYNDLGLCNADPTVDVHLTPVGISQAEALARTFERVQVDHIFVSELKRARQTAEILNRNRRLALDVDTRLNEGWSGFEGKTFEEFDAALGAAANRWTARFNDGESIEDIKARAADFIKELRAKDYESVLVVTSQWIIFAIISIVQSMSNQEAWDLKIDQGSCTELEI